MNDNQSVFDMTIPQLERYSRGEVLSASKMSDTVDVINRITRGLESPKQMKRAPIKPDEKKKLGKATGLYKITPDLFGENFMMIREVDPFDLRDTGRTLHMPSRAKGGHRMGIGGDDKIIWHAHGGAIDIGEAGDPFDNSLWEIDAERKPPA